MGLKPGLLVNILLIMPMARSKNVPPHKLAKFTDQNDKTLSNTSEFSESTSDFFNKKWDENGRKSVDEIRLSFLKKA